MRAPQFILLLICCIPFSNLFAANRYWVATSPSNWNNSANWSATSGGAGGVSVPGAADAVFFNSAGLGDCTLDVPVTITSLNINASYTSSITQGADAISISGAATFSGGNFNGGSGDIFITGVFTLSGANFIATTGVFEFRNNTAFTSGSFAHNNGTVRYNCTAVGAQTISGVSPTFNILEFVGLGRSYTISSTGNITVINNLNISGTGFCTLNTGTIDVQGDVNITNTAAAGGGTATINITGAVAQTINGSAASTLGALPKLTINKSSGTLFLNNFIVITNNFLYTAGTVNAGTSTVSFTRGSSATLSITGSIALNNIVFIANTALTATINAATILTVNGNFSIDGSASMVINTGNINVNGDIILTNTATAGGGSTTINITGPANQLIDGSTLLINQSRLPIININKPAGILSLAGTLTFTRNVTYTAGTIDPTTSSVYIVTSLSLAGSFNLYNVIISSTAAVTLTITTGSIITALNDVTLANNALAVNINTGTLAVQGNLAITNTATSASGTGTILLNGTGVQNITSSGIINQGRLPSVTINKPSGTLTFPSLITVMRNWTYIAGALDVTANNSTVVFSNSLTISGSHYLNNITFNGAAAYTIAISAGTTLTALGDMNITGSSNIILNTGNINLNGNLNLGNTATGGGGTATIAFVSAANQAIVSALAIDQSRLPGININKPAGTLTLPAIITVRGNWTYTTGTLDLTTNNSTAVFANTMSITGTHALNNLTLQGSGNYIFTVNTGTILTVSGSLLTTGASSLTVNTPVAGAAAISAEGDITLNNSSATGGGTGAILINGTGAQSLTGNAAAGQSRLPYVNIQKSSGALSLSGIISVSRNWTYTSGIVDPTTSTVVFAGNNLTVVSAGMNFNNFSVLSNTTTLGNNLTVNGDLLINAGALAGGANNIFLGGNWTDYGTAGFTEATSTINFIGTAVQSVSSAGGENFANAIINNTGTGIQLANDVTVATVLTMTQGNIDLNGNNLISGLSVANNGTLIRTAGIITGTGSFKRWFKTTTIADGAVAGLFPIGTVSDYRPFSVSAPVSAPSTGGTITVSYTDAPANSIVLFADGASTVQVRKDMNWAVTTANGLAGGTYNLRINGTGFGMIGNVADLRVSLVNSVTGTAGTNAGTSIDPEINRTAVSFANLSNTFYVASVNSTTSSLPITLVSFTATAVNNYVELNWITSAEINNSYFTVQRSADGISWINAATITGAGNSTTALSYKTFDEPGTAGRYYYRLMQTDFDGKRTYSFVQTVILQKSSSSTAVYPNPASNNINIVFPIAGEYQVILIGDNGQQLISTTSANKKISLDVSHIQPGIYLLTMKNKTSIETRKVLISK